MEKKSLMFSKGPLRHNFGEGHLNFGTPKRKGHKDLDYLRQLSTQTNDRLYGGEGSRKSEV